MKVDFFKFLYESVAYFLKYFVGPVAEKYNVCNHNNHEEEETHVVTEVDDALDTCGDVRHVF